MSEYEECEECEECEITWRNTNDWDALAGDCDHSMSNSTKEKLKQLDKMIAVGVMMIQTWEEMFTTSEQRITDMNAVAPHFFSTIQCVFLERVALQVCNLLDPHIQGKFTNFTLEMLICDLEKDGTNPNLISLLKDTLGEITNSTSACRLRELRNKHLAHFDEIEIQNVRQQGQMPYSIQNIKEVLEDVTTWIRFLEYATTRNYVQKAYGPSNTIQMNGLFDLLANNPATR